MFEKYDVVQFNEKHKWCGCIGFIDRVKEIDEDVKYLIGIQIPEHGTAYINVLESKNAIEWIGKAVLAPDEDDEEGESE